MQLLSLILDSETPPILLKLPYLSNVSLTASHDHAVLASKGRREAWQPSTR